MRVTFDEVASKSHRDATILTLLSDEIDVLLPALHRPECHGLVLAHVFRQKLYVFFLSAGEKMTQNLPDDRGTNCSIGSVLSKQCK